MVPTRLARVDTGMASKTLSPTQTQALRTLITHYRQGLATEAALWGQASADSMATKGLDVAGWGFKTSTWHALANAGMVTFTARTLTHESLRRGPYGKWIGGTVSHSDTTLIVRPTAEALKRFPD